MTNAPTKEPTEYLTSIEDIQTRTGLDFFPLLKDSIENEIEKAKYDDMWGAE